MLSSLHFGPSQISGITTVILERFHRPSKIYLNVPELFYCSSFFKYSLRDCSTEPQCPLVRDWMPSNVKKL